jgi:hypothetical protein
MRLFSDANKTYYQEVLRAVGAFVEEASFRDIRILETEDGLVVQGKIDREDGTAATETYLLTVDDLHMMLRQAYEKRSKVGQRI